MNNLVRIRCKDRVIIGQIYKIISYWENEDNTDVFNQIHFGKLHHYCVGVIEKDTNYLIGNIIIKDISEIEILREVENKNK